MDLLRDATIFLAAACVAVPVFRRLGFGAVLGYLTAGVAIGPWALGLVGDGKSILHFAELGVVFLLFVIGLELRPARLWVLRRTVFGLGALQVGVTAAVLVGLGLAAGIALETSIVLALALTLSSTAFVLQLLAERGELTSSHGRPAFGVLLFQDLAVIPILALLPALAASPRVATADDPWWWSFFQVGVFLALLAAGRVMLRPALRYIAYSGLREVFIGGALLLVLAAALALEALGLSAALGAFAAGVLLADSEYRHELEAAIDPFKGLLLGLFFLAVGMTLDLDLLASRPLPMIGLALALMAIKACLLFGIALAAGFGRSPARRLALVLSQGGEFGFVILAAAGPMELLMGEQEQVAALVVTLSMALTPLLAVFDAKVLVPRLDRAETPPDEPEPEPNPVLIAGFGRTGQVVARILKARGVPFTALERDPKQLDFVRRFGSRVYFGDAGHLDVLRAAGAADARLVAVCVSGAEDSVRIVENVRKHFPDVPIYAASRNRQHALALRDLGVEYEVRSTLHSALALSEEVLVGLGTERERAQRAVQVFERHDAETLERQLAFHQDTDALMQSTAQAEEELRLLIELDEEVASDVAS